MKVNLVTGSNGFLASNIIKRLGSDKCIGIDLQSIDNNNLLYYFPNSSSNPCFIKFLLTFLQEKGIEINSIIHTAMPKIIENDDRIENILHQFEVANIPVMLWQDFNQVVLGTEAIRLNNVLPYKIAKHAQELMCKEFGAHYIKLPAMGNHSDLNHLAEEIGNMDDFLNNLENLVLGFSKD